jgi:hypothetical protein
MEMRRLRQLSVWWMPDTEMFVANRTLELLKSTSLSMGDKSLEAAQGLAYLELSTLLPQDDVRSQVWLAITILKTFIDDGEDARTIGGQHTRAIMFAERWVKARE